MRKRRQISILWLVVLTIGLAACGGEPQEDPVLAQGEKLFNTHCLACHPTDVSQPRVGPNLVGLGISLETSGEDAAASLEESIRFPSQVITSGYQDLMPAPEVIGLDDADIETLVVFLLTLN